MTFYDIVFFLFLGSLSSSFQEKGFHLVESSVSISHHPLFQMIKGIFALYVKFTGTSVVQHSVMFENRWTIVLVSTAKSKVRSHCSFFLIASAIFLITTYGLYRTR